MRQDDLMAFVHDARERTLALVQDLTDQELMGPLLPIVNPLLWEIGHVAWFQEKWVLRHARGEPALDARSDSLYDSSTVPHDSRWSLPLYSREDTMAYLREVRRRVLAPLAERPLGDEERYFVLLSVFHEDMHDEAFLYTRQTLGYAAPALCEPVSDSTAAAWPGDVEIPGGELQLGASREEPFVFDNEKWAHPVVVRPFSMARAPATQGEFAAFVEDGGYSRHALWSEAGWQWRRTAGATTPTYWRADGGGRFLRRQFNEWIALEPHLPMLHVNWYEADAFCRWAGRRLPSEAEWEFAASIDRQGNKRRFPWGDAPPERQHANLDQRLSCTSVAALPAGDSAWGCRQMIGNVWEWTADDFLPYPGFVADPYRDYSEPWFKTHKVLRGGCLASRARLLRNTWRNFYPPDRRDVWAGFRTCAA